jgi:hypothetical protein
MVCACATGTARGRVARFRTTQQGYIVLWTVGKAGDFLAFAKVGKCHEDFNCASFGMDVRHSLRFFNVPALIFNYTELLRYATIIR